MSGADYSPFTSADEARSIERALETLPSGLDALAITSALRRVLPPDIARRAAELAELRARAASRFPGGRLKYLTRRGLEQATRECVARLRAVAIVERLGDGCVYDATCGLGSDALALAELGARVIAGDLDPEVARCARANLAPWSHRICVVVADAASAPVRCQFILIDPDRRARGPRTLAPQSWSPPLAQVLKLLRRFRGGCVKLSPAFDIGQVEGPSSADLPHRWQWVSAERELCETNLWAGEWAAAGARDGEREAVALAADGTAHRFTGRPIPVVSPPSEEVSGNCWLLEPDPAVIRAGLVGNLARALGAQGLAPELAFLIARDRPRSPWVRAWRILERVQADPRKVREALRRHDIGPLNVIKRGHPDSGEVLARRFRGPGSRPGLLAVARIGAGHQVFVLDLAERPGEVGDEGIEPPTSSL